uniref:Luciferase n=1 Tax=Pleuromamma sp. CSG-2001 TaxID=148584 RepID=Q9BLZ1_9MAXI|nr:luciferase [Pleuromamma sp. CSG-2001]
MLRNCARKQEQVCADVTEMKCQAVAWADCGPRFDSTGRNRCQVQYKDYAYKSCVEVDYTVPHRKQVPECKQVTKDNCVTDWEVDANGNKVWGGTEKCTPVTWEECNIVEKDVDFPTVKTECGILSHLKYADFIEGPSHSLSMRTNCQVKSSLDCRPVKTRKCATVEYHECSMKPQEDCSPVTVHIPDQEKVHQKKCLT